VTKATNAEGMGGDDDEDANDEEVLKPACSCEAASMMMPHVVRASNTMSNEADEDEDENEEDKE
jgi:hypothetical protein